MANEALSGMKFLILVLVVLHHYKIAGEHLASTEDFLRTSYEESCKPKLDDWVAVNDFLHERYSFIAYEKIFRSYCKNTQPYLLEGNFFKPSSCQSLTLCNSTYCLTYQRESMKFLYEIPLTCGTNLDSNEQVQYIMPKIQSSQKSFQNQSGYRIFDIRQRFGSQHKLYQLSDARSASQFPSLYEENFLKYLNKECEPKESSDLLYEGKGDLPSECEQLMFCNFSTCNKMTLTGNAFSHLLKRRIEPSMENLELPGNCHVIKSLSRTARGVWRYSDPLESEVLEKKIEKLSNDSPGLLRFNLPGYLYCGPGN